MNRLISAIVVVLTAIGLGVLAWPQLFGLAWTTPIAQLVALRGLGIALAIVLVIAFTLLALLAPGARRFAASIAVVLLAFCAVNAAVLASRGFGSIAFETQNESDITVLSWNTLGDAPGASVIAELAIEHRATIVALPETSNEVGVEVAQLMAVAGQPMFVYTVAYDQVAKARSTTLLISASLGGYDVDEGAVSTSVLPSVVATPSDGFGPTIVAVHVLAPIPPMVEGWRNDLKWAANACTGDNVILAGDFNGTLDHFGGMALTDVATLGNCRDAALTTNNAAVGTWPTALPALLSAPIDHVMTTPNWRVSGMRVIESHDKYGSDHRPILVQLSPAG